MSLHKILLSQASNFSWALLALSALLTPAHGAQLLASNAEAEIQRLLTAQTAGLPGKVTITVDATRLSVLPPCQVPEAFLPTGARSSGRVSVGVRCTETPPWTRYIPAYVALTGNFYVAARPIAAGQAVTSADVAVRTGDLSALPASVVTDPALLVGRVALNRIAFDAPIRRELLRGVILVQQGQSIKLVMRGAGFVASAEGKALTDAAEGALVQVKTQGGQLLSGIVQSDGSVERHN
jgi:flagella basal body P-ring formation protein FlgA